MSFHSLSYFLFLPIVFAVFYLIKDRFRWIVLLIASIVFYAWLKIPYLLIVLLYITLTSYFFSWWVFQQGPNDKKKQKLFWLGIFLILAVLIYLKYLPFLISNLHSVLTLFSSLTLPMSKALITIGVSFYTFQAISYLTDVYLGKIEPEKHFGYFALYLSFFPKLLQGPIERASNLLPQLKKPYEFNYAQTREGLILFTWGLFKKVVIADRLGFLVNTVFEKPEGIIGIPMLITIFAYSIQIYMDFSGYTDMALGTAKLFGIELTDNFRYPYLSRSISEFWRRWHITFSTWLMDYIFKPLQMRYRYWKVWGSIFALMITFFISGLWHGASWNFVIWGLLHGFFLSIEQFWLPIRKKWNKKVNLDKNRFFTIIETTLTFCLVSILWVFFRAESILKAIMILRQAFQLEIVSISRLYGGFYFFSDFNLFVLLITIVIYISRIFISIKMYNRFIRTVIYITVLLIILLLSYGGDFEFVYNQF